MAKHTDDADYDSGETFENVPSLLSDAGNDDNHSGRRLRTRCILPSRPDNKTRSKSPNCFGFRWGRQSTLHTE
ncbi:unnamed protein product [Protopolystoma xenopodis]|uniref:Uncharacterized protein n=1 Tax=Protopolystoma xenopodis TaxID=117903 RepID=A0A448XNM3_9PLAT|nr:unnamed protein product [Protopolystoma xenopodis]